MAEPRSGAKQVVRDEKGRFVKGASGNPKGRPALAKEFKERCRDFMKEHGWRHLVEMAQDPKSPFKFRALELIAQYAYGKPTQPISGDDEMPALRVVIAPDDVP